jgi:CRP-like cAMP-binding protein
LLPVYRANNLLAIMCAEDRARIQPLLHPVELKVRQSLARPGHAIEHVYFIDDGMVSVVARAKGDNVAEVAVIGSEGATGCAAFLEAGKSYQDIYMQVTGKGHRIGAPELQAAMRESDTLRRLLLQYLHTIIMQQDETAISAARGSIRQRLARWLLMAQDRLGANLQLTHDFLGVMLAVRRPGVTAALQQFSTERLIVTGRGRIHITNRERLHEIAGAFYGAPGTEYRRLFSNGNGEPGEIDAVEKNGPKSI